MMAPDVSTEGNSRMAVVVPETYECPLMVLDATTVIGELAYCPMVSMTWKALICVSEIVPWMSKNTPCPRKMAPRMSMMMVPMAIETTSSSKVKPRDGRISVSDITRTRDRFGAAVVGPVGGHVDLLEARVAVERRGGERRRSVGQA